MVETKNNNNNLNNHDYQHHPLLSGGRRSDSKYSHGFSNSQILSLTAMCEAFIPPISLPENDNVDRFTRSFYAASGSQFPVPQEVAEKMVKRYPSDALFLLKIVLILLSTKLGTLLLCGTICFDTKWPFIHSFSDLSVTKREKILQKWSNTPSSYIPLRIVFMVVKLMCFYIFFTLTDENSNNPSWEAIGYNVKPPTRGSDKPRKERPLDKGVVEPKKESDDTFLTLVKSKGLEVEDSDDGFYNIKCDVVIVGSGCGGGVAAAVLANSGHKVVVIEKGNYYVPEDYSLLEGPSMNELYENGGILSTVDGKITLIAGSTVGGGSAVNWSACIKTPNDVLENWAVDKKIPMFGTDDYRSAMDVVSERLVFEESGGRKRCRGAIVVTKSSTITRKLKFKARVTIAAAGSLSTPPLLVSSGLTNHHIGRNLHLHPVLLAWGYFPPKPTDTTDNGKCYEGGIITSLHKVKSNEDPSKTSAIVEAASMGPASFASLFPWISGADIKDRMIKYPRITKLFSLVKDQSSGEVREEGKVTYRLTEPDKENLRVGLREALRILVSAGAEEIGTFRNDGQRIKCRGIESSDLEEFLDTIAADGGPRSRCENWTLYCTAHQMGSCKMGCNEDEGAVDVNGESWEAKGLFVCDGSLLPTAVGVNPMITIESTAYYISKKIGQELRKGKF
ncbi:long-chain-alcohol oxidase FAO2 [Artemisia annua]|uniref:Long-chain-alcohol oxidase n=1 Tax=Artemisia annua TaxID=35608 RepID=A0A2U1LR01_ARTAN|nr:long-chain-alcohol oxidase FAO2 [Artemisia annua]